MEQFEPSGGMEMDMSELLGDDETYEPPAWMLALENILYYVVTIALITGLIVLVTLTVYKILKAYRNRYEKCPRGKDRERRCDREPGSSKNCPA